MTKKKGRSPRIDKSKSVFIYHQFAEDLRKKILAGTFKPGEYIPSERQLAADYNINRITVRRGINRLIKEGLLYTVPGTGTFVSDNISGTASKKRRKKGSSAKANISCMVRRLNPSTQSPILSPYYVDIFTALQQESTRQNFNLSFNFITSVKEEREIARTILESDSEGVVVIGKIDKKFILSLYNKKFPLVLLDNYLEKPHIPSIMPDNEKGAYEAVKHLLDLKHKKIGFISAPLDQPAAWERLAGYKKALAEAGLGYDGDMVVEGYFQSKDGYQAMCKFLKKKKLPTGIVAINDEAAIGAIKAIRDKSKLKVPEDISVVGFDDIEWSSHTHPPLTTIRIYKAELGKLAIRRLKEAMEDVPQVAAKTVVPVELIVRKSTAPAKK